MKQIHYKPTQIEELRPNFIEWVKVIITDMLSIDPGDASKNNFERNYTIAEHTVKVIFRPNPLKNICSEFGNSKVLGYLMTATFFIHGVPYAIKTDQEDYTKSIEDTLKSPVIEALVDNLICSIQAGMARYWYNKEGMAQRIHHYMDNRQFEEISEHVYPYMYCGYDKNGYHVSVTDDQGKVLIREEHHNSLVPESPNNTHKQIATRYLDEAIILLLASSKVWRDQWSAPIF